MLNSSRFLPPDDKGLPRCGSVKRTNRCDTMRIFCHNVAVPKALTKDEAAVRRASVLTAARWCFLNFGFTKTAFEDIAKRANLSRTLLYRLFKDKEEIYQAVFADWLISRQPAALRAANGPGSQYTRLLRVCNLMVLEPWAEMTGAPMASDFFKICERIDPENEARFRIAMIESVSKILNNGPSAEVFLLALDGLFADQPSMEVLEQRTKLLVRRFAHRSKEARKVVPA